MATLGASEPSNGEDSGFGLLRRIEALADRLAGANRSHRALLARQGRPEPSYSVPATLFAPPQSKLPIDAQVARLRQAPAPLSTAPPSPLTTPSKRTFVDNYARLQQFPSQFAPSTSSTPSSARPAAPTLAPAASQPPPSDLARKGLSGAELHQFDQRWVAQMKKNPEDQEDLTFAHFQAILALHASHPLGGLFWKLLQAWDEPYARMSEPSAATVATAAATVRELSAQLFQHATHFYRTLFANSAANSVASERLREAMHTATEKLVWAQIYPAFFRLLCQCYDAEDQVHSKKFNEFLTVSTGHLGVSGGLWLTPLGVGLVESPAGLPTDPPYHRAIAILKQLPTHHEPGSKLKLLIASAEAIVRAVADFYAALRRPPPPVGGDDFLPLFVYVVIKANVARVYSESVLMELFISDAQSTSREGYMLATFQTALAFVCCLERNQLESASMDRAIQKILADSSPDSSAQNSTSAAPSLPPAPTTPIAAPTVVLKKGKGESENQSVEMVELRPSAGHDWD